MAHAPKVRVLGGICGVVFALFPAISAWAVQAPVPVPPTHERQCVTTGEVPAGSSRRINLVWKRPFATAEYAVIGSVADSTELDRSIELSHIVAPYTPQMTAAIVLNRDASTAHSGVLCLDASTE
jgi:hypothetical protein